MKTETKGRQKMKKYEHLPVYGIGPVYVQSARVLALRGEDDLRRIQVHEDRDVIVPSLAGGLVESDIADPGQIPPLEGLFRVMPDHAPEACVVHVQLPRQGLDGYSRGQGQNQRLEKQSKPAAQ